MAMCKGNCTFILYMLLNLDGCPCVVGNLVLFRPRILQSRIGIQGPGTSKGRQLEVYSPQNTSVSDFSPQPKLIQPSY